MSKVRLEPNSGDPKQNQVRYAQLTENTELALADRVACFLLALGWSDPVQGEAWKSPHGESYSAVVTQPANQKTVPEGLVPKVFKQNALSQAQKVSIVEPKITVSSGHESFNAQVKAYVDASFARRQLDIGLDCTAATLVDDTWFVAANSIWIRPYSYELELGRELGQAVQMDVAEYPIANLHAEMKVLKRLQAVGKLRRGAIAIGVSKPCCPACKEILDAWGVDYSFYHSNRPPAERWVNPNLGNPD